MSEAPKKQYNLERLNFLIVDDNKHMRALVKTILHALGSKGVHEAADGAEAFKELRHFPADIIICDWNMSPLDGLDFVRLVRTGSDSPNPYVPIIMLTGHTEMSKVVEARDSGVNEFLAKPISAKSLYSRIKAIIDKPRGFIKTKIYFGPDRRRQQVDYRGAERRVKEAEKTEAPAINADAPPESAAPQEDRELSQDEVEALLNG